MAPKSGSISCIGKGKAAKPAEFGCKATVAATNARAAGGQFVVHIDALHGNPYDGHTLKAAVEAAEASTGCRAAIKVTDSGNQDDAAGSVTKEGRARPK